MNTNGGVQIWFFVGPSLAALEIRAVCVGLAADVRVLPPIQQGDLLRRGRELPDILAIIDGHFHHVPAVQHKEILLALSRGVRVLGAASLGALRAAELDVYGMEGVGTIYRLFKENLLDGDDEVALAHAGPEDDFRPLTMPLVTLRHHLEVAQTRGIIAARTAARLRARARRLHFSDRTYERVLQSAAARLGSSEELAAFRRFLRTAAPDVKHDDARALVRTIAARVRGEQPWPERVPFSFQRTKYFRILERDYLGSTVRGHSIPDTLVLSFHKLLSHSYAELHKRVALRCLAVDEALHRALAITHDSGLLSAWRQTRDLTSEWEYEAWLHASFLSEPELLASLRERDLEARLLDVYRTENSVSGDDARVLRRVLTDVAARVGVDKDELLTTQFMQPGILWEEPFIREIKLRGDFPRALEQTARILECEATIFQGKPELKLTFDSLLDHAAERVERWLAGYWGVPAKGFQRALRERGFVRYRDFLHVARLAYVYATQEPSAFVSQELAVTPV